MKYYQLIFLVFSPYLFLNGTIKKLPVNLTESRGSGAISKIEDLSASPEISIADTRIVEGNMGQRSLQVMVIMSKAMSAPVTVVYYTTNGTALAGSDYDAANDTVKFSPGQVMQKITLSITGDVAIEADETFKVFLTHPVGAIFHDSIGTVNIVNDDSKTGFPAYEVRFTFKGFMSFYAGLQGCPVRPDGIVVMSGLLSGRENVTADEDISYEGTLQMDMDIDICSADLKDNDTCRITIIGSGVVKTELKISFDGRGAYIQLGKASDRFLKNVSGTCDSLQMDEERTMVPDKTIASAFNGTELAILVHRTLRVGRYVQPGPDGIETVVEVLRKIR